MSELSPKEAAGPKDASLRVRKVGDGVVMLLFLVGILLPMARGMEDGNDQEARKVELRELAKPPAAPTDWSSLAAYPTEYEDYFNDHFGLRGELLQGYMHVKADWFGLSPSKLVVLGTDGWLYFTKDGVFADYRGETRLHPAAPGQWRQALLDRRRWLNEHGATYLFAVAPNKVSVHPEHLPPRQRREQDVRHRLDQIRDHVEQNSDFEILDLRGPLREMARTERTYLITDSHWTQPAAFVAYQHVMRSLAKVGVEKPPMAQERFGISTYRAQGDLARMLPALGIAEEEMQSMVPVEPLPCRLVEVPEHLRTAPKGWNMWEPPTMYECPGQEGVLLMFKDSFAHHQMPWFACHFRYSYFLSMFPQDLEPFVALVGALRPTVVIEQRVERNMYGPPRRLYDK